MSLGVDEFVLGLLTVVSKVVFWDSRGVSLSKFTSDGSRGFIGRMNLVSRYHMKILIAGGAGVIGSSIAESYVASGHSVSVVDDLSTGCRENLPPGVYFFEVNITDNASLERVFEEIRPNIVSHRAAQMDIRRSMREPFLDAEVNIEGEFHDSF